jgi:hypothetical protein
VAASVLIQIKGRSYPPTNELRASPDCHDRGTRETCNALQTRRKISFPNQGDAAV